MIADQMPSHEDQDRPRGQAAMPICGCGCGLKFNSIQFNAPLQVQEVDWNDWRVHT